MFKKGLIHVPETDNDLKSILYFNLGTAYYNLDNCVHSLESIELALKYSQDPNLTELAKTKIKKIKTSCGY